MPSQSRKRKVRGRSSTLPPIIESSKNSPRKATSQSVNAVSSKGNPFRQASCRYTRPSVSSETTRQFFSSPNRIPAHRKSVATTIDLSKSETIMKKVEKQRRESMISVLPGRRISFGQIGSKITSLIKAKNAFTDFKRRQNLHKEEVEDTPDEKAFEIETLPHKARFASTLSAEAQYAMMKGYEDKVYGNLCKEFPEYRFMLRRSRTPLTGGVTVCSKLKKAAPSSKLASNLNHPTIGDETDGLGSVGQTALTVEQITLDADNKPASTSTPLPEDEPTDRSSLTASPVQMVHWSKPFQSRKAEKEAYRLALKSAKEKQLIMTYRYHCAMDILDVLRKKQGGHSLSPRMNKKDSDIEPLKDYNSWAYVWNYEFEPNYRPAVENFHEDV